ncbi:hypothetical protein CSUI_008716 [Cystoisospora suis]|uniref:Uncharacterized protein n=1 Tax=Cystoisospora suis TaxID=483139 RepID=A0A2C6KIS2_9APIC|nr:hypothetical protein CSUI_008716 [Cystoisospora suis]
MLCCMVQQSDACTDQEDPFWRPPSSLPEIAALVPAGESASSRQRRSSVLCSIMALSCFGPPLAYDWPADQMECRRPDTTWGNKNIDRPVPAAPCVVPMNERRQPTRVAVRKASAVSILTDRLNKPGGDLDLVQR